MGNYNKLCRICQAANVFCKPLHVYIIERGFDPIYGARPLKRYLQSAAETLIAKEILRGDLAAGSTLVLDAENGELSCRKK